MTTPNSVVALPDGQHFDIATDKLVSVRRLMQLTGGSRSTIQRWIKERKFPAAHFCLNGTMNRWVERLVLDFMREHWTSKLS